MLSPRMAEVGAEEAMRGDVLRGIAELVTNSDDAYIPLGHGGPIEIEVEHRRSGEFNRIVVRDQAVGMSVSDLYDRIATVGGYHDEVAGRRGFFGLGAKDAAIFGKAVFETMKGGRYAALTLLGPGKYEDIEDRPSTDFDSINLGIEEHGTMVTVYVNRKTYPMPQHTTLVERLTNYVQLREIVSPKSERLVTLRDLQHTDLPPTRLQYQPLAWQRPVHEAALPIPGYPEAGCQMAVLESESALPVEAKAWRHGGILVIGGRAIYQSTYFGLEGRPGALWFTGRLQADYIEQLQREWEECRREGRPHPRNNPFGLVTRGRIGLREDHPFSQAMATAVESVLRPLVEAKESVEQAERRDAANADTRRRLREAERLLGRVLAEVMREEDVDLEGGGSGSEPVPLEIVPPKLRLEPGEERTVLIRSWPEVLSAEEVESFGGTPVSRLALEPEVAVLQPTEVDMIRDPREPRRLRGTVRIRALDVSDVGALEVTFGTREEMALIEVTDEVEDLDPPTRLRFVHQRYRLRPGIPKKLVVQAPSQLVEEGSTLVRLRPPAGLDCPQEANLRRLDTGGVHWYECAISVVSTGHREYRLRADAGNQSATCTIDAGPPPGEGSYRFDLDTVKDPKYPGADRWDFHKIAGVPTISILTQHKSLRPYFGADAVRQGEPECKALLAEVISEALATTVLREQARKGVDTDTEEALRAYRSDLNRLRLRFAPYAIAAMNDGAYD